MDSTQEPPSSLRSWNEPSGRSGEIVKELREAINDDERIETLTALRMACAHHERSARDSTNAGAPHQAWTPSNHDIERLRRLVNMATLAVSEMNLWLATAGKDVEEISG